MTGAGGAWRPVALEAEIIPGRLHPVVVDDVPLALCRLGDSLHAVADVCPHEPVRLSDGSLDGAVIVCPLHGARFDVTTGRCLGGRAEADLDRYRVRRREGVVELWIGARDG